jgi:hypothetical protein
VDWLAAGLRRSQQQQQQHHQQQAEQQQSAHEMWTAAAAAAAAAAAGASAGDGLLQLSLAAQALDASVAMTQAGAGLQTPLSVLHSAAPADSPMAAAGGQHNSTEAGADFWGALPAGLSHPAAAAAAAAAAAVFSANTAAAGQVSGYQLHSLPYALGQGPDNSLLELRRDVSRGRAGRGGADRRRSRSRSNGRGAAAPAGDAEMEL